MNTLIFFHSIKLPKSFRDNEHFVLNYEQNFREILQFSESVQNFEQIIRNSLPYTRIFFSTQPLKFQTINSANAYSLRFKYLRF